MGSLYYADILDVLRAAGCKVAENGTTNGWQKRARASGGFNSPPLGIQWHHTASATSPANDLGYMINGSSDAPIGNMLLDRTGTFWPIAAGAANTAGKGGPLAMSRGTIPLDGANATTWAIEAANNGVGEAWPQAQIDAYFRGSNAMNKRFGNKPTDVFNHCTWAPGRKIDPATAGAVQGPWKPRSINSSQTWNQSDVTNECSARAGNAPTPEPRPPEPEDITPEVPDMTDEQAAQLAQLHQSLVVVGGNPGQVDPSGNPTNTPWLLWYVNLGQAALDGRIQNLQAQVDELIKRG